MNENPSKKNGYWSFNLPLQVWPYREETDDDIDPENDNLPIIGTRIVNYMPRKETCSSLDLAEVLEGETREEFFLEAAERLEHLAKLMRAAAADPALVVYYHDQELPEGQR